MLHAGHFVTSLVHNALNVVKPGVKILLIRCAGYVPDTVFPLLSAVWCHKTRETFQISLLNPGFCADSLPIAPLILASNGRHGRGMGADSSFQLLALFPQHTI